jgi:hypothetical protein
MGVATTGRGGVNDNLDSESGATVPLFRLGGGVAYRLDQRWDLSLDYKTGFAPISSSEYVVPGHSQQSIDLQALNIGMSYAF